ncbi:MAG: ATP-binding protein [Tannerellaceae bacterium]|jgi:AAA15 family ATPase/GTPase|nr:ATP-binding protein [Tannerellaceae bacterium]
MILNVSVKNYRSYKDEAIFSLVAESSKSKAANFFIQPIAQGESTVKALNTALIFGANASGKSNLFRVLFEISKFIGQSKAKAGEPISTYDPFLFEEKCKEYPMEFYIEFVNTDHIKYKYELHVNGKAVLKETLLYWPNNKQTILFERILPDDIDSVVHKGKLGASLNGEVISVFQNQAILSKFGEDIPNEIITPVYIYLSNIQVVNACNSIMIDRFRNNVGSILSQKSKLLEKLNELLIFADTGLRGLNVNEIDESNISLPDDFPKDLKSQLVEKYKYKIAGRHPLFKDEKLIGEELLAIDEESNGTKQLFAIGGIILNALDEGKTIFIDEIDASLHTNLSKVLISLFQNKNINKKNAQLIVTTHDVNLLDRLQFRKDQIWFAEKDKFGVSSLFTLQDFSDVREDTPFDKWYLAGKFGAIPNIKSIESLYENEK